jgi:hypothetical protein
LLIRGPNWKSKAQCLLNPRSGIAVSGFRNDKKTHKKTQAIVERRDCDGLLMQLGSIACFRGRRQSSRNSPLLAYIDMMMCWSNCNLGCRKTSYRSGYLRADEAMMCQHLPEMQVPSIRRLVLASPHAASSARDAT